MNTKQKKKIIVIGIVALVVLIPVLLFTILKLRQQPSQQISQVPGLACPVDAGKCEWDAVNGATSYDYKVIDLSNNTQVKAGNTTSRSVTFQPEEGKSYKCEVTAKNNCGSGNTGTGTGSCSSQPPTPTPTNPPAATPTPTTPLKACNETCQVNSNCTNGLICYQGTCRLPAFPTSPSCQVPTPTPSPTTVPTATPIPTATPTQPPVVNNPPPPVNNPPPVVVVPPTATPIVIPVVPTTPPQQPTVPPSGSVGVTLGIVAGVIITLVGGAVLLLL